MQIVFSNTIMLLIKEASSLKHNCVQSKANGRSKQRERTEMVAGKRSYDSHACTTSGAPDSKKCEEN
jgi:hypothetical protein